MIFLMLSVWTFLRAVFGDAASISLENVALRYQLVVLQRSVARARVRQRDRIFLVWLARLWKGWRSSLVLVQPATVLAWHRQGFQLYWRWKSRTPAVGRPPIDRQIRDLIRRMACENPTWGRRRIQAELHFLGYDVAELTIAKYMRRRSPRPSPTWRTFLAAHLREIVAENDEGKEQAKSEGRDHEEIDGGDRRELVHVNATSHPTAMWAARQVIDAFPYESAPKYLLRDRDAIYGDEFTRRIADMGVREVLIAPRAPWQNPYAERLIGSIRRECLDHFIVLNERHLRRLLRAYRAYYIRSVLIKRSATTAHTHDKSSRRPSNVSWRSRSSVACITATSTPPDRRRSPRAPSVSRAVSRGSYPPERSARHQALRAAAGTAAPLRS